MTARLAAALREFVPRVMALTGTPGLNLAVAWRDEPVCELAFGVADLATGRPMTTRTLTRASSLTKTYTALAAMQLAERGALDLAAPVARNPLDGRPVTVLDLLSHRSGLATDTPAGTLGEPLDTDELLARTVLADRRHQYADGRPCWTAPVGTRFAYSNLGIALVGHAVERAAGRPIAHVIRTGILEPLGMRDSRISAVRTPGVSTGYARFADAYVATPDIRSAAPAADGLITAPGDHVRLLRAFLGGAPPGISPEAARRMIRPRTRQLDVATEEGAWYGLGVEAGNLGRPDAWFGHSGAYPFGWWADGRAYPRQGLAVVVCTNKWDVIRWYNPAATIAPGLIAGFVSAWVDEPDRPCEHTWAWRRAYAAGLLLADRIGGLVAPGSRPHAEGIHALGEFDPDGFAAGLAAVPAGGPDQIARFVRSRACPLHPAESEAIALSLGGRGRLPVPMPYWAAAPSQRAASATSSEAASTTPAHEKKP